MATIALYREMLVHSWDEKLYRQFSYYHGLSQASLSELAKTYESDETWGPWFKERATYQASVYEALQPYIVKKRKGESMTAQDNAELTQIQREVTAKLGRQSNSHYGGWGGNPPPLVNAKEAHREG